MYRFAYVFLLLGAACFGREPRAAQIPRTEMLTLRGTIRLAGDVSKLPDVGGDVHLFVYERSDEGYCLRRDAVFAEATQLLRTPSRQELSAGIDYEVHFLEPPGQTYDMPRSLYVTAVWQNTRALAHACEVNTLAGGVETFNAYGAHGVSGAQLDEPETSACCHFVPEAITLKEPGTELSGIDVTISVRPATCVDPLARGDACFYAQDSACGAALGAARAEVLVDREGAACP
jgi:hypothetical protein